MTWLRSLRSRVRASWWGLILAEHDTEPTEMVGGLLKVVLGAWLMAPWWHSFNTSEAFNPLTLLPEWGWGIFLLLVGAAHLAALRRDIPGPRRGAALVGFLVWFSLSGSYLMLEPSSIGGPVLLALACGQGWAWIRLGGRP